MKKMFFLAATAALALSSCTSDDLVQAPEVNGAEDGAVVFSAGVLRDARGSMQDIDLAFLQSGTGTTGFGVFAFEHGKTPWNTYNTYNTVPNFMFNQDVTYSASNWTYSPVKYFSNNESAQHSFFAYAPYNKDVNAVFSLANGAPAIRYNAADNYDLLWAKNLEVKKLDVDSKVNFAFKHALSKVDFKVTYFVDKVHDGTHTDVAGDDFKDTYTTVTVRSVKFVGAVPSQGVLNLGNGNWTYEATEEGAYEFATETVPVSFTSSDPAMTYKSLKQGTLVLPTIAGNNVKVQVVYDVTTVDTKNPRNNSTITNTITSKDTDTFALEAGHHYIFKLDLGLTSVKFNVTEVAEWGDVEDLGAVDLPDNFYAGLTSQSMLTLSTTEPTTPIASYAKYYDAEHHQAKKRNAANTDWENDDTVNGVIETTDGKVDVVASGVGTEQTLTTLYYNPADGKLYSNAGFTGEVATLTQSKYYKIGSTIYKAN